MEINTILDLNGKWEFVNLHYTGLGISDFTTCANIASTARTIGKSLLMSLTFTNGGQNCTIEDKCNGIICDKYIVAYQPTIKRIIIGDPNIGKLVQAFTMVSYNAPILKLQFQLPSSNGSIGTFDTAELILKKVN